MKATTRAELETMDAFGIGLPNDTFATYFTGTSYRKVLTPAACGFSMSNITFEPGCRNNWHVHRSSTGGGQMLICTAGEGWYQEWGKPAVELTAGTIIAIPANTKHWHGAKRDSWFSHIAFEIPGEGLSNEWLEEVSDEHYLAINEMK